MKFHTHTHILVSSISLELLTSEHICNSNKVGEELFLMYFRLCYFLLNFVSRSSVLLYCCWLLYMYVAGTLWNECKCTYNLVALTKE